MDVSEYEGWGVKGLFGCDTCVHLCRCAHAWKSGCKRTMWWGGGGQGLC